MIPVTLEPAAATRVLLANDGSTTKILAALLGCEIRVHVLSEIPVGQDEFSRERAFLPSDCDLIARRSVLRAGELEVSENLVLYPTGIGWWDSHSVTPIGLQLERAVPLHQRQFLSSGIESESGCVYKEYVIRSGQPNEVVFVKEMYARSLAPPGGFPPSDTFDQSKQDRHNDQGVWND